MNVSRRDHASCAIGRQVYVFCGTAGDSRITLNSIEVLDLHTKMTIENKKQWHWRLIRAPASTLQPRYQPSVCPINQNEIAILGGWASDGYSRLGDVVLFNTRTKQCTLAVSHQANDSQPKFNAFANQSGRTKRDTIMALVSDQSHKPCLVEYRKGAPSVSVVLTTDDLIKH